ncbi:MAG: hypothetical protein ACPGTQ_08115 [Colwellia sp.]
MNDLLNTINKLMKLPNSGWNVQKVGSLKHSVNEGSLTIYISGSNAPLILGKYYLISLSELLNEIAVSEKEQRLMMDGISKRERSVILLCALLEHFITDKTFNDLSQTELVDKIIIASVFYMVNTLSGMKIIEKLSCGSEANHASFFIVIDYVNNKMTFRPFGLTQQNDVTLTQDEVLTLVKNVT